MLVLVLVTATAVAELIEVVVRREDTTVVLMLVVASVVNEQISHAPLSTRIQYWASLEKPATTGIMFGA